MTNKIEISREVLERWAYDMRLVSPIGPELRALLAAPVVERQEPVAWEYKGTSLGDQLQYQRLDHYWMNPYATHEHDYIKGVPLYREQPPVAVVLPERKDESKVLLSTWNKGWNACLDKFKELNQ